MAVKITLSTPKTGKKFVATPIAKKPITRYKLLPKALQILGNESAKWDIHYTEKQIIFGCGAVKVNKSDLKRVLEYREAKKLADKLEEKQKIAKEKLFKRWENRIKWHTRDRFLTSSVIDKIPDVVIKKLLA